MSDRMKMSDEVTVGPQPSEQALDKLPGEGFESVVNFRTEGEDDQPLSPDEEGDVVERNGLHYLHIPVSADSLTNAQVDQFRTKYRDLPKPVFAHCKSGKRAGALVMMHTAVEQGWSGDETLKRAEEMGFECDNQKLIDFVKSYVDSHTKANA